MLVSGVCMLVFAVGAFLFKTWILYSWPRAAGVVVSSRLATSLSDDGTVLCSAVHSVQYSVNGKNFVTQQGGRTFTNNCAEVKAEVESVRGQNRTVTYNKLVPESAYVEPGFNFDFYFVAFILTCLGSVFAVVGWVCIRVVRRTQRKGIGFP
ncbi:MAG: DUF3592 domain-containing protein [Terriglobales bacterium]